MKRWILAVSLLLLPGLALAGAPVNGVYYSVDQPSGTFLTGHFTESWVSNPPNQGQVGNAINAQSWDGTTLGAEWWLSCPAIAAPPTLITDAVTNGDGFRIYQTTYSGGVLWLSATGPWGDEDYYADVLSMTVSSTHLYTGGTLIDVVSDITLFGSFRGYAPCFEYTISNAAINGYGDTGTLPMGFPPFVAGATCDPVGFGAWGDVTATTLTITGDCSVGNEVRTWGALKARF
jgi:hypothetical protein